RLLGSGRGSSAADWSWDQSGKPLALHQWWTTTQYFESTESYHVDGDRVVSGRIVITNPPGFGMPETEEHEASYNYDDGGRLIERLVDGKTQSRARFDAEGRLVELINGNST